MNIEEALKIVEGNIITLHLTMDQNETLDIIIQAMELVLMQAKTNIMIIEKK